MFFKLLCFSWSWADGLVRGMRGTKMIFGLALVWLEMFVSHDSADFIVASLLTILLTVYPVFLDV